MRKFTLNIFTLSLGLAVMPMVEAAPTAQQQLLEQVRLGEATHREDLVQQSLYRLELIDPNNPDVVAARFRSLLRQGDIDGAQKQLDRLSQLAPSSNAYKSSRTTMLLSTPDGRQALQQARLQATTGHAEEAVASYNKLFNGAPPEGDIAVEYWSTVAKIPARRGEAINQLKRINADAPGNTGLQNNLALLLFSSDRRDEGFAVLEQMAKSNAGREGASKIWYGQIKDMPVSDASVSALKKYLSIFSDGDSVAAAQSQLAEQQKQLADPAFRARAQGLAAVDSGMAGKAIPELQQAVRANPKDSEALGALGQAYSQKGDRANAVANLEKALALDPHSSNNDKWNSLLKVNRYWLAIQQGDAALKANNPDRAERLFQQARNVDNTDSYAVLGLGDVAMARKDYPAAERYYQQTLRMDSGNTNAVRGLANIYRQQSPEKAEAFIASLSASQRRSIDDISLNNQFLQSFNLSSKQEANRLLLRIPVLQGLLDGKTDVSIPALKLGATNQLRFDFEYMNPMPGGSVDNCITFQPVQNHVVIGDDSTIDFSKYYHFIPMPDLRAFANAGFPFSRMADLSQTITVMPKAPNEAQMETLLNTVGFIGAQTGFPAINLTVTDDGSTIQGKDADIMIIGGIPDKLKDDKQIDLLVQATESWVKTPMRQTPFPGIVPDESDRAAETRSTLTSSGAMAAVIGFQSPYNDQRSVIALLADSPRGYEMLNDAVNDSGKRATMFGSVAVIRESGINSLRVGDVYYVGHLPWFERVWYALANHPILLAVLAAISVILLAWVLWRLLRIISRRRLNPDNE